MFHTFSHILHFVPTFFLHWTTILLKPDGAHTWTSANGQDSSKTSYLSRALYSLFAVLNTWHVTNLPSCLQSLQLNVTVQSPSSLVFLGNSYGVGRESDKNGFFSFLGSCSPGVLPLQELVRGKRRKRRRGIIKLVF